MPIQGGKTTGETLTPNLDKPQIFPNSSPRGDILRTYSPAESPRLSINAVPALQVCSVPGRMEGSGYGDRVPG